MGLGANLAYVAATCKAETNRLGHPYPHYASIGVHTNKKATTMKTLTPFSLGLRFSGTLKFTLDDEEFVMTMKDKHHDIYRITYMYCFTTVEETRFGIAVYQEDDMLVMSDSMGMKFICSIPLVQIGSDEFFDLLRVMLSTQGKEYFA